MNENPEAPGAAEDAASALPLKSWHLSLTYDGTAFSGWQIQPDVRTVQGELQERLRRLLRCPDLRTVGCSRTDAGVHALDQQVSFEAPTPPDLDADRLRHVLNRWLPADVRVNAVRECAPGFSARHDARGKAYVYVLSRQEKPNPLFARFCWHVPRTLDLEAMGEAAGFLRGEKDFSSFAVNPKREIETHVRHVFRVDVVATGEWICFHVSGASFLYKMVRSMVGWLVHVGKGNAAPEDTQTVLDAKSRTAAADSAPPQGLFLAKVFFTDSERETWKPTLPPFAAEPR